MQQATRIAIVGTGALGGFYGALLARAGNEVHFLVRSDYDHVAQSGLRIDSVDGDFAVAPVNAHASPRSFPPCSLAVVCLKSTHNSVLPEVLPQVLEPGGAVVLLQNGLGEEERIAAIERVGTVISALGFVCATKVGPGHIRHLDYGMLRLAQFEPGRGAAGITPLLEAVAARFEAASVKISLAEDWLEARWQKLVWNIPFNGLSVVLRANTKEMLSHEPTVALVRALMLEVTEAAAAEGRDIGIEFVDKMIADTATMRPYLPSMRVDFDERRTLETEAMYRVPVRRGAEAGVAMARTAMLATELEFLSSRSVDGA